MYNDYVYNISLGLEATKNNNLIGILSQKFHAFTSWILLKIAHYLSLVGPVWKVADDVLVVGLIERRTNATDVRIVIADKRSLRPAWSNVRLLQDTVMTAAKICWQIHYLKNFTTEFLK